MNRNPLNIIATMSTSFTKGESKIAKFVLNSYASIPNYSIKEFAKRAKVAESSVIRFAQKLGYDGYSDFKLSCATTSVISQNKPTHFEEIISKEQIESNDFSFGDVLKLYQYHTTNTIEANIHGLDYNVLNKVAQLILNHDYLLFCGEAESGYIAENAYSKFNTLFRNAHCATSRFAMVQESYLLKNNDLIIAISQSGKTTEVVNLCKKAKQNGATVICFTATVHSPLYNTSDYQIVPISLFSNKGSRYFINQTIFRLILDSLYIYLQAIRDIKDNNTNIPLFDHNWFK